MLTVHPKIKELVYNKATKLQNNTYFYCINENHYKHLYKDKPCLFTIPENLKCPSTGNLMLDPVVNEAGNTYERSCIKSHYETCSNDPKTNEEITTEVLFPNNLVVKKVMEFLEKAGAHIIVKLDARIKGKPCLTAEEAQSIITSNNTKLLKDYIKNGFDPNITLYSSKSQWSTNCMALAINNGSFEMVKLLVEKYECKLAGTFEKLSKQEFKEVGCIDGQLILDRLSGKNKDVQLVAYLLEKLKCIPINYNGKRKSGIVGCYNLVMRLDRKMYQQILSCFEQVISKQYYEKTIVDKIIYNLGQNKMDVNVFFGKLALFSIAAASHINFEDKVIFTDKIKQLIGDDKFTFLFYTEKIPLIYSIGNFCYFWHKNNKRVFATNREKCRANRKLDTAKRNAGYMHNYINEHEGKNHQESLFKLISLIEYAKIKDSRQYAGFLHTQYQRFWVLANKKVDESAATKNDNNSVKEKDDVMGNKNEGSQELQTYNPCSIL